MPEKNGISSEDSGGIWNFTSLAAGSIVIGVILAFAGPFLTVLGVAASIIYGTTFMFRLLTPKGERENLKDWEG